MRIDLPVFRLLLLTFLLEDGLVLLNTIRRRFRGGDPVSEAVRYGVTAKLRPVLMTTFTTVFGILPLLLATGPGAEIQRPLATVVMGGLLTSTLVTLVVLPLAYQTVLERDPTVRRRGNSIRH